MGRRDRGGSCSAGRTVDGAGHGGRGGSGQLRASAGVVSQQEVLQPYVDAEPDDWRTLDSQRLLVEHRPTRTRLEVRSAEPRTLHGIRKGRLFLLDEPSQWLHTVRDRIWSAVRTSLGKVEGGRLLALGTRSADPSHWFERLLRSRAPTVYARSWQAPPDADPFSVETWRAANPSYDAPSFAPLRTVIAAEAHADPSLLAGFRALRLNGGTSDVEIAVLVTAEASARCECDILPTPAGPMVLAFDLSGGDAQTAAAAYWPTTGRLEGFAAFPALPGLAERGRTDGADYQRMHDDGDLLVMGRRVAPIAEFVATALQRWGRPARIVADYHAERELRQALEAADFPPAALVTASMGGLKDSPGRVRDFRRAVGGGRVYVRPSSLVRQSMANARTVQDSMGEERLIKGGVSGRKRTARDDVAVAIAAAVSEGARAPSTRRKRRHYVA